VSQWERLERKQTDRPTDDHANCGEDKVDERQRHVGKMNVRVNGFVEQNYRDGQRNVDR